MSRVLVSILLLINLSASAALTDRLLPSQPSRPGANAERLNAQIIDLTLSDAIYLGLRDNRAIRSAYLDRVAQKFDLLVAEDRFTPKLVLSGSYLAARNQDDRYRQRNIAPTTTLVTPYGTQFSLSWTHRATQANDAGNTRNDGASITVIQPLLRGAGRDVATAPVRLAQLAEQTNRLTLKTTVAQTVTQIILSYRELLRAQEQRQIAGDALTRSRRLLDINRALIAAGRMAEFDIVQTEADVATQELSYEDTVNQLDNSRLELLQLLALDLQLPIRATEKLQASRISVSPTEALKQAEALQPEYLKQLIAGEQADINLVVAGNERLWDVSLVGGGSQLRDHNTTSGSLHSWENYAGVQVEIPIGDMSLRQAEIQAKVNKQNQRVQLAETRQQLRRDVTNAVRDIDVRWRQFEIAIRARDLTRRKLEIEREKLTVGRSSNFQVLSYEADLRNAENAQLDAQILYLNAQAELDQTLGTTLQSWDISLND